jgi:hypothetical protein
MTRKPYNRSSTLEEIFRTCEKPDKCKGCKIIDEDKNNLICKNCKK